MSEKVSRYVVAHGYVADEALWCGSDRFDDVCAKVKVAWRLKDPVLKYSVPVALAFGNNKSCSVVIGDQQDFALWYVGSGDTLNPKPFTSQLTVYERGSQPQVLSLTEPYHISMGHWSTVSSETMHALRATVILRHSACDDVILFDRPDVNGPSYGGWGRAVCKVRDAWHTRRPVFRYVDESPTGARVYVSIIDADDFATWRKFRAPLCPDLVVFDAAEQEEFVPIKSDMMNEVVPAHRPSGMETALAAESRAVRAMVESSSQPAQVVLASRFTAATLSSAVANGDFGPSFTTAAKPNSKTGTILSDEGAQHFAILMGKLAP